MYAGLSPTSLAMLLVEEFVSLLPDEKKKVARARTCDKPAFTVEYRMDAKNLCADFREDIQFRFSYSPSALLSRYMGRQFSITALWNQPSYQVGTSMNG